MNYLTNFIYLKNYRCSFIIIFCFLCLSSCLSSLNAFAIDKNSLKKEDAEQELFKIINLIQLQQIDSALDKNSVLLQKYPNFKLLNAIQADLLFSKNNYLDKPFASIKNKDHELKYLLETNARLDSINDNTHFYQQHLPDTLKYIDKTTRYFFIIDFSKSRLYLYDNSKGSIPMLIADHYVTTGQNGFNKQQRGDKKSPLGVYHITSFLEDNQLPELYGWGAFPINYPNAWDKEKHRTGSGIWLHGVPRSTYSRPPLDSKGCLVISNDFLTKIAKYLKINTPVILSQKINWIPKKQYLQQNNTFKTMLEQWRSAWQTKNLKRYLGFYSKKFATNNKNFISWAKHKKRIFSKTKNIKVKVEQLNIFSYPGEKDMLAVSFYQRYKGDSYKSNSYKLQYWIRESDKKWRIIYEYSGR